MSKLDKNQDFRKLYLDPLPDGWKYVPLGELVDSVRGISYGIVQPGSHMVDGVPIVRVNNLQDGRIVPNDIMKVSADIEEKYLRTKLRGGEVLLSLVGSLGQTAIVSNDILGWNVARAIAVIPVIPEISPKWVDFALRSPLLQHYIHTWATTTVQATLNLGDVVRLPIPMPQQKERKAIIEILSVLDDKINLNRRMNTTLEYMAWTIFKNQFIASEHRGKWDYARIGDKLITYLGGTPSRDNPKYWDNGTIPWINSGKVNEFRIIDATEYITEQGLENSSTKLIPIRATVIAITGATLGQVSLLEIEACTNQSVVSILGSDNLPNEFVYFWIKYQIYDLISWQTGGAQQHINKNNVNNFKILCPDDNTMGNFILQVRPVFDLIRNNCFESRTLTILRNTLLPKLMRGELRVRDVEKKI